jgi:IS30 family transposase
MHLSMTYNNVREMADHQALSQATGIKMHFAHPYSSMGAEHQREHQWIATLNAARGQRPECARPTDLDAIVLHHNVKPRKSLSQNRQPSCS